MPLPIAAKVSIAAVGVAAAVAVAIYESPEVRRVAEDLRRRIAIALRSLGDDFDPDNRQPRFNRPEDAHGFYESHNVEADDETRRRQREELMYWNARRNEQQQQQSSESPSPRLPTFDDFLRPDNSGERGTLVYNTGANPADDSNNMIRRRGNLEGVRGLNAAMVYNPFADEHGIEMEERPHINDNEATKPLKPDHDETVSDIYAATPRTQSPEPAQKAVPAAAQEVLFDFDSQSNDTSLRDQFPDAYEKTEDGTHTPTTRSETVGREEAEEQQDMSVSYSSTQSDAYASIQAWAQSNTGFYSPLPVTPEPPMSEGEFLSQGQRTPTDDTASVAESGVDVDFDAASSKDGNYGVMSDSDDGIATPGSWSEVGSVISETESVTRA
ncbi:hypothetical protein QBC40DRAFT_272150 [Triangularia verruculosa]|uniref:Uncharacterized protein n=1 Tax=Triangularia verruculosa TaxID=2587418 RepID=A0AAN7AXG7_9PEZI|nr:hypothetical protein QBC40DRAFT_272150 [Triangularia verruculosa]